MKATFSVVLVTYRRPRQLRLALEGLASQELAPNFEVLVIDNDPCGSGREVAAPFLSRYPGWRHVTTTRNNVSLARNLGAGLGGGEWLAFLDDDCVPPRRWLADAAATLALFPGPGLVLGGGYTVSASSPVDSPQTGPTLLGKDEYLVEGNLFFRREEYLALEGMKTDLGPGTGRFGYHEGSELQDRHRITHGPSHRRVLQPQIAVHHLQANPLPWPLQAFLAGFDAVRAFSSQKKKQLPGGLVYQVLKLPLPLVRILAAFCKTSSIERTKKIRREVYRMGEIFGDMEGDLSRVSRWLSAKLRRANNRIIPPSELSRVVPRRADLAIPERGNRQGWMAGKVGTTELLALEFSDRYLKPVWPRTASWRRAMHRLFIDSGVFPETKREFGEFLRTYREAVRHLDAVCAWQTNPFLRDYEEAFLRIHCPHAARVSLNALSTEVLVAIAGRRWLVVSSFPETMRRQAPLLPKVHAGKPWAPRLSGLETRCEFLPCPTFSYLAPSPFPSWSEGLKQLTQAALAKDFEVALIGAGAWSLPLAARLKEAGRIALHLGGETQLVFGIKGQRWEKYGIYNEHWVRPLPAETPPGHLRKEQGCYW